MRCLSTFSDCGWAYGFTCTSIPPQKLPHICESWLKSYLMQVYKPCSYALVEAVEPFKLHSMSLAYIYEVYKHLLRLWMGIWLHTHTVTTEAASSDIESCNPTWCKCANHATTLWLRLINHSNCIPCPCHTYMRGLRAFSGWGWACGITFTSLPPQTLPQICESWLKSYLI